MRRTLFTVAAALSLLLCVSIAPLWVRSYLVDDSLSHHSEVAWHFRSRWGCVGVQVFWWGDQLTKKTTNYGFEPVPTPDGFYYFGQPARPPSAPALDAAQVTHHWRGLGFEVYRAVAAPPPPGGSGTATPTIRVAVPHWFLTLLTLWMPVLWVTSFRRRRRLQPGRCGSCGYDMRATPDRCPECGTTRSVS